MYRNYISSISNQHIKYIKKIINSPKRYRDIVVEGEKNIKEFLNNINFELISLFVIETKQNPFSDFQNNCYYIEQEVLKFISSVESSQGVIGLFRINYDMFDCRGADSVVSTFILDGISDPGNLGTIIRTAVALGKKDIICVGGVFPFSSKVIRSSAGMISHIRIFYFLEYNEKVSNIFLKKNIAVLDMGGIAINSKISQIYCDFCLVLGNEGRGVSSFWKKGFLKISLPMDKRVESLNVAVVGSIIGYLVWRD